MHQISRRIANFLAESYQKHIRCENLRKMSYFSTDSAVKTAPKKSPSSPKSRSRVSKASQEADTPQKAKEKDIGDSVDVSVEFVKVVEEDSVEIEKESDEIGKPGLIPWQTKAANSVNLIGHLGAPLQLGIGPDGVHKAVSILVNDKSRDIPHFWIPIVFRGDLAQVATCNLREKDHVYVTGQLTGQPERDKNEDDCKLMVLVKSISYVLELGHEKESRKTNESPSSSSDQSWLSSPSSPLSSLKEDPSALLWDDLFQNPHKWLDNRSKENKRRGGFKHKESGKILELNESTPGWVLSKIDSLVSFRSNSDQKKLSKLSKNDAQWTDLLENPEQWEDNRESKLTGKLNPKFPDFRQTDSNSALWLDSAPEWALLKLETIKVGPKVARMASQGKNFWPKSNPKEEKWKDLIENPQKWWDNRWSKTNPKAPDFKHKDTGDGLWLDSSVPSWIQDKLPSPLT